MKIGLILNIFLLLGIVSGFVVLNLLNGNIQSFLISLLKERVHPLGSDADKILPPPSFISYHYKPETIFPDDID
jgi:hypothetical protein